MLLSQAYKDVWSFKSKLAFRFIFCYLILYIFLMFLAGLFEGLFRWIGVHILNITYDFEVSGFGSGDNSYAYITLFVNVFTAIIATLIWSILGKKQLSYNKLFYWFIVVLRVFLIGAMLLYGFVKVFQIQFRSPSLIRLLQPLGEFSPMGLAWTYMGYSKGFGMFAGLLEIIGGLLLIPRRTTTLGSFIIIGVMLQVAMMNMMFDIPVKLFSIHLILMAFVIFMTDIRRFSSVFIKNKATESYNYYHPITSDSYHKTIDKLKKILVPIILITACILGYLGELNVSDKNHKPHLYGIWETEIFIKNKDTIKPLLTATERWRYLVIENKRKAIIRTIDDKILHYNFKVDTTKQTISMYLEGREIDSFNINYIYKNNNYLKLRGHLDSDSIEVILKKKNLEDFPLKSRGFHWINERPFNH